MLSHLTKKTTGTVTTAGHIVSILAPDYQYEEIQPLFPKVWEAWKSVSLPPEAGNHEQTFPCILESAT